MSTIWVGVDFDGTLCSGGTLFELGEPVPRMIARVKKLIAAGVDVRIFTARVAATGLSNEDGVVDDEAFAAAQTLILEAWSEKHIGKKLRVTCKKDMNMAYFFDDRALQVEPNTGRRIDGQA